MFCLINFSMAYKSAKTTAVKTREMRMRARQTETCFVAFGSRESRVTTVALSKREDWAMVHPRKIK